MRLDDAGGDECPAEVGDLGVGPGRRDDGLPVPDGEDTAGVEGDRLGEGECSSPVKTVALAKTVVMMSFP